MERCLADERQWWSEKTNDRTASQMIDKLIKDTVCKRTLKRCVVSWYLILFKEWSFVPNSRDSRGTHTNSARRVTFFSKMAFGECRRVWRVRATRLGECRQFWQVRTTWLNKCWRVWRVRATRLNKCRRVWRVKTSTQKVLQTRPRVHSTFAKFALAKFARELPLLNFVTKLWNWLDDGRVVNPMLEI